MVSKITGKDTLRGKNSNIQSPAAHNMSTNTERFMQSVNSKQINSDDSSSDYFSESEEEKINNIVEQNRLGTMDEVLLHQLRDEIMKINQQQEVNSPINVLANINLVFTCSI
jgi:hypothetical protein